MPQRPIAAESRAHHPSEMGARHRSCPVSCAMRNPNTGFPIAGAATYATDRVENPGRSCVQFAAGPDPRPTFFERLDRLIHRLDPEDR